MHIRKYPKGFSRRHFMQAVAAGAGAGVLAPLWDVIAADGDVTKAYPDELLSLDEFTGGKLKAGDVLDASNVDIVKDLLDPIAYIQVSQQGRIIDLQDTTTDIMRLNPPPYLEATLNNRGKAKFDAKGNVVTQDGQPWIGGNPFPDGTTGAEVLAGHNLSWGRHDVTTYTIDEYDMDGDGNEQYHYQFFWVEVAAVARTVMDPKPYFTGHEDKIRYQSAVWTYPNDVKGTSILNIWPYDQTQYPDFYGYLPAFKRVRRFPTNQRFEPVIAGSTFYLTEAWMTGDPTLTWGNFKIVHRGPMLACADGGWNPNNDNWMPARCGGKTGKKFWRQPMQLVPEAIVVELEPTGYPRSPYSKKRIWFDARTMTPMTMVSYDRRGEMFKQWEGTFSTYDIGGKTRMDGQKHPVWSWNTVHSHDIQSDRITSFYQCESISGGYKSQINYEGAYDMYCTQAAIRRLGT